MICEFDAFSTIGSICFGSPQRTTTFPPNGISKAFVSFSDNPLVIYQELQSIVDLSSMLHPI